MASSAENSHRHLPAPTAAPPPTPSSQPNLSQQPNSSDFLSHLLHRLPPTLSLSVPPRRSSPLSASSSTTPLLISLSDSTPSLHSSLLSASTQHGFFNLTPHSIPSHLPLSAESNARSLFDLPLPQKQQLFPANWPFGYEIDDDDDSTTTSAAGSFCLESSLLRSAGFKDELDLDPLREFAREMEKLGLKVLDELAAAVGFENPGREGLCCLLWISDGDGLSKPGRVYPYVVGLHYQVRCHPQSLFSDSGWVSVSGQADSVLVTLGDIAQVWSNGKLKKVRGRPVPSLSDQDNNNSHCITMSLLITLPIESIVSPLIPNLVENEEGGDDDSTKEDGTTKRLFVEDGTTKRLFNSFSFEDYAWRVYHERLLLKDPLVRYRV